MALMRSMRYPRKMVSSATATTTTIKKAIRNSAGPFSLINAGSGVDGAERPALCSRFSSTEEAKNKGINSPMPMLVSFQIPRAVQPIAMTGSLSRQIKKRIRLTRERSRRTVAIDMSMKLRLPCMTAKNEKTREGKIRKRKTQSSTHRSLRFKYRGHSPLTRVCKSSAMR